MLTVNYITRPWFFDISVEFIREFKNLVQLNVIIIISPGSAAYLGISDADAKTYLNQNLGLKQVLPPEVFERLNPYFEGANVICKFEQHKESSFANAAGWFKLLRDNAGLLKADINIIETLSLADWYLLIKLRRKKTYYIIHDPQPHTGEGRGRVELINKLYFPYVSKFITYSAFSADLFKQHYAAYAQKVLTFKMPVYTTLKAGIAKASVNTVKPKIVFFGRISAYKGVELFYEAAAAISQTNANVNFVIAGKAHEGYDPAFLTDNPYSNIQIRNRFIGLDELGEIMNDAQLCVLPYFDATQSGVIMTCYAYGLPVLVSDCAGLLEYCFDHHNFSFKNRDLGALTAAMQRLLDNPDLLAQNRLQIDAYVSQNVSLFNSNLILAQHNNAP